MQDFCKNSFRKTQNYDVERFNVIAYIQLVYSLLHWIMTLNDIFIHFFKCPSYDQLWAFGATQEFDTAKEFEGEIWGFYSSSMSNML